MSTGLRLSVEEYARLGETGALDELGRRLELIDGEIREMSSFGPIHCNYVDDLTEWSVLATMGTRWKVHVQSDIVLANSQPVPDLVWMTRRRYRHHLPTAADIQLVIKVANSSLGYDLGEKAAMYASHRITEYWVVDVQAAQFHVHRSPSDGIYESTHQVQPGERLSPKCHPEAALDVSVLFVDEES